MKKTGMKPSPYRTARPIPDANNVRVKLGESSDVYGKNRPNATLSKPSVGLKGKQK